MMKKYFSMSKLSVFFPGIVYTVDKPLMHYSRRLAADMGCEIRLLPYSGFPKKVIGDKNRMDESYRIALEQTRQMLSDIDLTAYEDILFVGKSIGTIVAAQIASESPAAERIRLVLYTPLEHTFSFPFGEAIVFTGDRDQWVGSGQSRMIEMIRKREYPCYLIPGGNHSLETKDVQQDIQNMQMIMRETAQFMNREIRSIAYDLD